MDVGIIGTGDVGTALATGLSARHDVVLGSRRPGAATTEVAPVESQRAAATHGEVVVLAVPASAAASVARDHRAALADTTVVDATNEYPEATTDRSVAARVAEAAPDARVVKAFNTVGANLMADPTVDGTAATMLVAGNDPDAVEATVTLAADLGFDPLVAGDRSAAGRLEDLARLWIDLSRQYGRDVAFRLLRS